MCFNRWETPGPSHAFLLQRFQEVIVKIADYEATFHIHVFFLTISRHMNLERDAQTCVPVAAAAVIPGHPKGHSEVTS